ncbi:hypothetical protein NXW60_20660 [Bacteroides fragilis]|nr:hypothetical protein NXW60_20660 [Bacteroides fragilis]
MANKKKKTATTNAGAKSKEQLVIHQIVVKAPQRKVYDVGNWRTALSSADNGRTKQLYDLLDDIMIDGVLSDAVQKRIDAVTNSELTFQNAAGEEVEEIADPMDTTAWEDLLTEIPKKKIYGRSGIEMTFNDGFNVEPIPAKHINLEKPHNPPAGHGRNRHTIRGRFTAAHSRQRPGFRFVTQGGSLCHLQTWRLWGLVTMDRAFRDAPAHR